MGGLELAVPEDSPAGSGARRPLLLGLAIAALYLALALPRLGDYGPTWDFVMGDYPYGERLLEYLGTGDERFLDLAATEPAPRVRAPHPDFAVGRFKWTQIFPVAALLSAASCRLFWTELGWIPPMAAHHLPVPLLTALLVAAVTAFAARRWGALAGVVAGGTLVLNPNFFALAQHDLKDVTECVFYTGAVLAGFRALVTRRTAWWVAAGALTGLALAQKANAFFLPVQLGVFLLGARLFLRGSGGPRPGLGPRGFLAATAAFLAVHFAVSPPYWRAPSAGPRAFFAQVLADGSDRAGLGVALANTAEVLRTVLVTTPPVTLLLGLLGVFHRGLAPLTRWFLVLGVTLPIARNFLPGMRHYDGSRHFLEFLPMLALLAGNGAARLAGSLANRAPLARWAAMVPPGVAALALAPPLVQVLATHPNQVAYFNALIGGLGGAQRRGLPDAGDYWGNSYWQGLAWLSAHAEPGAGLIVPLGAHVARSAAPVRLRPDVRLLGSGEWSTPVYVMYFVRPSFYGPFTRALEHEPALHEIRLQGGVLLRIHRFGDDPAGERLRAFWRAEHEGRIGRQRILAYLRREARMEEALAIFDAGLGAEETAARLRSMLPDELDPLVDAAVEVQFAAREGEAGPQ